MPAPLAVCFGVDPIGFYVCGVGWARKKKKVTDSVAWRDVRFFLDPLLSAVQHTVLLFSVPGLGSLSNAIHSTKNRNINSHIHTTTVHVSVVVVVVVVE